MSIHYVNRNSIPRELKRWRQWVVWRWKWNHKQKTWDKAPINPRKGKPADVSDLATWGTFDEAWACKRKRSLDGVGFVFTPDDPYCGVDLDDCLDPDTGEARLGADDVIDSLGSYAEISPSGCGVKAIVRATKQGDRCSTKSTPWGGNFEVYDQSRFFALTGNVYRDAPVRESQEAVDALYEHFFPEDRPQVQEIRPSVGFVGDDEKLLEKARSHPKTGRLFRSLFDVGVIPGEDRSRADQALCDMLAYWTGCDAERMRRLFLRSALAQGKYSEKGRHGDAYLDLTVSKAIRSCKKTYDPSYGERVKSEVREIVAEHCSRLSEIEMRETKRRVLAYMLTIAATRGKLQNGAVVFNANQEEAAEVIGLTQRGVSKILRELDEEGRLPRISQGRKGKNSFYRLEAVEPRSTTYVHSTPPVRLRSRTDNQPLTIGEGPMIGSTSAVHSPTLKASSQPTTEDATERVHTDGDLPECGHGYVGGKGCFLHDPDHPYRRELREAEERGLGEAA